MGRKRTGIGISAGLCCLALMLTSVHAEEYRNQCRRPDKPLVVKLDRQNWQALSAVCATPAFYNNHYSVPLIFDDQSGKSSVVIEHETTSVKSFGPDAAKATAAIAKKYWTKAETVFVVDNYEQALWVAPSAALLSAPILVDPDAATLRALGVKKAVLLGGAAPLAPEVVKLAGKEAAWKFQMSLMKTMGQKCDYLVMTNPYDTADKLNPDIRWPYLSMAAAPLAAYRHALVQTGDYTGDRKRLDALGVSTGSPADKAAYEFILPTIRKVKDASYAAEKFMADRGEKPMFLGMVGCPIALPFYICDIHTHYRYWDLKVDYVPSDIPYATMKEDIDFTRFVKPDLAVGRILADNVQDATLMLTKTFFIKDFLPNGKYASVAPSGWEGKAALYDGHRLDQPNEGGPPASPDQPFYPASEVMAVFKKAGLKTDYLLPRDETKPSDTDPGAAALLNKLSAYGVVQFIAHGDPAFMQIETGGTGKGAKNYQATGLEFRAHLNFPAPTSVYVIGCHVGTVYAPFANNKEFLPTAAIHKGAVLFIAPHTCQSICFWRYAPKGPASSQAIYFWKNALVGKQSVGQALIEAKWKAYQEWRAREMEKNRGKDSNNATEPDPFTVLLFGDPALKLVN